MKQKLKRPLLWSCIIALIVATAGACAINTGYAKNITVNSGAIPPELPKQNFTFLGILKGRRSYDKYLKKGFARYTGEYKLCKQEQLESDYADIDKYRFYMDHDREMISYYDGQRYTNLKAYKFYIYDRKEKVKYYLGGTTLRFYETIANYVLAVDAARPK